jgi:hypothetical protein
MRVVTVAAVALLITCLPGSRSFAGAGDVIRSFPSYDAWSAGLCWDGTSLWEAGRTGGQVYQMDPLTGALISSFSVTGTPRGITFDGTYLWLANSSTSTIQQYTTSGTLVSSFPTAGGTSTRGMAWDGTYLYNSNNGGGTIFIYTTTGTLVGSYTTAALYPYDISWDYTGPTYMWCADPAGGNFSDTPDMIVQLDASGNQAFAFRSPGTVSAGVNAYPSGITVIPPYIFTSDAGTDTIYVIDPGVPVPVELASFTGDQQGSSVVLTWTTITETNNLGFRVYRSTLADVGFRELTGSLIPGAGTTGLPQSYCYVDPRVSPGTYYYQLEDVSLDGGTQRHGPVVVSVAATGLVASVENPATGAALIRFTLPSAGRADVAVYDARGSLVRTLAQGQHAAGGHAIQWDGADHSGSAVAQGFYLIRIQTDEAALSLPLVLTR